MPFTKHQGKTRMPRRAPLRDHLAGRSIDDIDYCVLDCEMSGLDVTRHEIISIGAVRIQGGEIDLGNSFYRVIRPERVNMSVDNVLIHRLNHDQVSAGEDPFRVMDDFLAFIADTVLVGHFISIDLGFLNALFVHQNRSRPSQPALDTRHLHEWYLDQQKDSHREPYDMHLTGIVKRMNIPQFPAHHAFYDALTTACLFVKQLDILRSHGHQTLGDIYQIGREW